MGGRTGRYLPTGSPVHAEWSGVDKFQSIPQNKTRTLVHFSAKYARYFGFGNISRAIQTRERGNDDGSRSHANGRSGTPLQPFLRTPWGRLHQRLHKSAYSLTEMRVFHELTMIGRKPRPMSRANSGLDTGYLSRLLSSIRAAGFHDAPAEPSDARQHCSSYAVRVTRIETIDSGGVHEVSAALGELARRGAGSTGHVDGGHRTPALVSTESEAFCECRSAVISAGSWNAARNCDHEARAAEVVARLLGAGQADASRAVRWIAEQDCGARIGAAVVMPASAAGPDQLLFVEPGARRRGLGTRLVSSCAAFASSSRYENPRAAVDDAHAETARIRRARNHGLGQSAGGAHLATIG